MNDSWGDGGTAYSVADPDGNVLTSAGAFDYQIHLPLISFCVGDVAIPGCTDETACNYNAAATEDDGSCATLIMNFSTSNDTWTEKQVSTLLIMILEKSLTACQQVLYSGGSVDVCVATTCYYIVVMDHSVTVTVQVVHGRWITTVLALSQVEATGGLQIPLTVSALALDAPMQELRTIRQQRQATMVLRIPWLTDAAACNYNESQQPTTVLALINH